MNVALLYVGYGHFLLDKRDRYGAKPLCDRDLDKLHIIDAYPSIESELTGQFCLVAREQLLSK